MPARPTANRLWGDLVWQRRIETLLPGREDLWWKLDANNKTDDLAAQVVAAIEEFALPAIREQIRD